MVCPKCERDYHDPARGKVKGFVYRGDDSFGMKYRRYGMVCTFCGFIAEIIARPTGEPYHKRKGAEEELMKRQGKLFEG